MLGLLAVEAVDAAFLGLLLRHEYHCHRPPLLFFLPPPLNLFNLVHLPHYQLSVPLHLQDPLFVKSGGFFITAALVLEGL